jgi:hypothetical protein
MQALQRSRLYQNRRHPLSFINNLPVQSAPRKKGMTIYFYDDKECVLIAIDTNTRAARTLQQAVFGTETLLSKEELPPSPAKKEAKPGYSFVKYTPGQPCDKCGSKGKRHKKDCPRAGQKKARNDGNEAWQKLGDRRTLSKQNFDRIETAQVHDIPADAIARELGLALEQVNGVFLHKTCEDYLAQ